jgi:aminocarboxymuconate-semialdehyde decarboxylase
MIVDIHSHYLPLAAGSSDRTGVRIAHSDDGAAVFIDASGHQIGLTAELTDPINQLEKMDRQGLDQKVLAVPPFCFQYDLEPISGCNWSRALNEGIAEAVRVGNNRFTGFATVPLQHIGAAVEELDYAITLGLQGVEIGTNINGVELDEPSLDPFWERCALLNMPILIHPHYVAGVGRMNEYHLRNLVGNPLETALAGSRLIFGGVLERFPELKMILSHGGGALPGIIGRLEHGRRVRPECQGANTFAVELQRLYFDSIVFDTQSLRTLVSIVGSDRIVLGTDYPFDMSEEDPIGFLRSSGLADADVDNILSAGAGLLRVPSP